MTATVERADLAPGDLIEIVYGDTENQPFGVRVQPWCEADPEWFVACIDARGTKDFRELDGSPVTYKTYPGPPESIVAVLPSLARVGETAPLRLAVLDRNLMPPRHALPHPSPSTARTANPPPPKSTPIPHWAKTDPDTNGFRPIPAKGTAYPETPVAVPDPGHRAHRSRCARHRPRALESVRRSGQPAPSHLLGRPTHPVALPRLED